MDNKKNLIFEEVKKYTKKNFNEKSLIKDLEIDSLDLLMLVTDLEKKFNLHVSDQELMEIKLVDDIINIINNKENKK
ncbi:acyl carrier protein [Chlamydia abortus]|nr:acyl carrier protein [Chlamydia abortus]SGA33186.1 acyl carrier protein [Chlamydia abortus]SHE15612.1 acyl carrier protein [Chlamydia abortus]